MDIEAPQENRDPLKPFFVPEEAYSVAYSATSVSERALIKTCLARHFNFFNPLPHKERGTVAESDYCVHWEEEPAPFFLLLCTAQYPCPTSFIAAIAPGLLARVPRILVCFVPPHDGVFSVESINPSLLTALELAGLEEALLLHAERACEVLTWLRSTTETQDNGRIAFLNVSPLPDIASFYSGRLSAEPCLVLMEAPLKKMPCQTHLHATADLSSLFGKEMHIWSELPPSWFRNRRYRYDTDKSLQPVLDREL